MVHSRCSTNGSVPQGGQGSLLPVSYRLVPPWDSVTAQGGCCAAAPAVAFLWRGPLH
jgi:hypothetical protein